ncbi:response regulator receiver [Erwinia amylovora Ea644]|nr:response regulator receiver [Erwinia amylovora Ea644]
MMDKKTTNLEKVHDLLEKKGVDKRKQSSTLAEILGIKYNSAKQKLDGKRSISLTEIKKYIDISTTHLMAAEITTVFLL